MGKKKIKSLRTKEKKSFYLYKKPQIKLTSKAMKELQEKKEKDIARIIDLVLDEKLDPYKIEDYKYIKSIARTLGWSTHRMFEAIKNTNVKQMLDKEKLNNGGK